MSAVDTLTATANADVPTTPRVWSRSLNGLRLRARRMMRQLDEMVVKGPMAE